MQRTPRPQPAFRQKLLLTDNKKRANIAIVGLGALVAVALVAAGAQQSSIRERNAAAADVYTPAVVAADADAADRVTFAAVGDSITAANSESIAAGKAGNTSWAYYADQGNADLVGGWAQGGATTADMAKGVKAVDADVPVILAGTNDVGQDIPFEETTANLETIVETAGVDRVIVSSVPPRDEDPEATTEFNYELRMFVGEQDWEWVDASRALQSGESYKENLTQDGIHPTQQGQKLLGAELRKAITAG